MSLRYKLSRARSLLASLSADEHAKLRQICKTIRQSQEILLANALPAMQQCLHNCEGLCCRNAQVDDIIGLMDLVYILTLTPEFEETMTQRVTNEKPFYSQDCMFLKGDSGPCLFASAVRPEVCITTFCSGDRGIQKEIQSVKRQFFWLNWFFLCRKPQAVCKALTSRFQSNGNRVRGPLPSDQANRRLKNARGTQSEQKN